MTGDLGAATISGKVTFNYWGPVESGEKTVHWVSQVIPNPEPWGVQFVCFVVLAFIIAVYYAAWRASPEGDGRKYFISYDPGGKDYSAMAVFYQDSDGVLHMVEHYSEKVSAQEGLERFHEAAKRYGINPKGVL